AGFHRADAHCGANCGPSTRVPELEGADTQRASILRLAPLLRLSPPGHSRPILSGHIAAEESRMASTPMTREAMPTPDYAPLAERIVARDQKGASDVLYGLFKQRRPATEILRETVRIHAPFTHVPYHQRLDDGIVKFVNNDHCLLSERVGLPLMAM